MFTQPFIQAQISENIKAPRHWPLCGEFPAQMARNAEKFPFDDVIMLGWGVGAGWVGGVVGAGGGVGVGVGWGWGLVVVVVGGVGCGGGGGGGGGGWGVGVVGDRWIPKVK